MTYSFRLHKNVDEHTTCMQTHVILTEKSIDAQQVAVRWTREEPCVMNRPRGIWNLAESVCLSGQAAAQRFSPLGSGFASR